MVGMLRPRGAFSNHQVVAMSEMTACMQLKGRAVNLQALPPLRSSSPWTKRPPPTRCSHEGSPVGIRGLPVGIRGLMGRASSSGPLPLQPSPPLGRVEDPKFSPRVINRPRVAGDVKLFSAFSPKASASALQENALKRGPFQGFKHLPPENLDCFKDRPPETSEELPVRQRMAEYDALRQCPRPRRTRSLKLISDLELQAQQEVPAFLSAFKRMMPEEGTDRQIADFLCAEILSRVGHTTPSPRSVLAAHALEFQAWTQGAGAEHAPPAPVDLVFIAQIARAEDNSFTTRLSLVPPTHPPPPTPTGGWTDGSPGTPGGRYLGAVPPFVASAAWGRAGAKLRAQTRAASAFAERVGSAPGGEERDGWFRQIICKRVALVGVKSERDVVVL
ncbi:hypothetical protein T484DRAFT_1976712 [Baffinella frigidus]|nr:hypothetical protein T484DRAFT_1976712 [Cryptophyta sp. CCMP2293]